MFAVIVFFMLQESTNQPTYNATVKVKQPVFNVDKSPAAQKKRQELLSKFVGAGLVLKYETPSSLPPVFVTKKFFSLDIDTKKSFASAFLAYYYAQDDSIDIVVFKDSYNGKELGTFSQRGLRLD